MQDEDFFWDGAQAGRLLVQRCGECGLARHPPAPMCARCQSLSVELVECSGKARVLGWLLSRHPTRPGDKPKIVVRVELPEGVFMISNLQDLALENVKPGLPVEVFFQEADGKALPQFRPAPQAAS